MANTATINTTYTNEAGTSVVKSVTLTGDMVNTIEREGIAAGEINVEFDVPLTVANILAFGMSVKKSKGEGSDKTVGATVKTNSTSTPAETFLLTAENGLSWSDGDPAVNPLATDLTKLFVTNTGTAKIDFAFRVLIDSTPGVGG